MADAMHQPIAESADEEAYRERWRGPWRAAGNPGPDAPRIGAGRGVEFPTERTDDMSEEQKPAALTPGCAAMDRMRARFDAHYGDLAGVMRAALAWRSKWADYQRPYNAQMERPVMEADVDEAECRLSEAVQARVDAAVAAERERLAPGALRDVAAERRRQIEVEGWMPDHDDRHRDGSLAKAAYCYAWAACGLGMESPPPAPPGWPWAATWWKPRDARSNLVRAAALLLAEIERLDRQSPAGEKT